MAQSNTQDTTSDELGMIVDTSDVSTAKLKPLLEVIELPQFAEWKKELTALIKKHELDAEVRQLKSLMHLIDDMSGRPITKTELGNRIMAKSSEREAL